MTYANKTILNHITLLWNYILLMLHCMNGTYLYIGHFHNPSKLQRHFLRYSDFNKLTKPLRIHLTIETVRQPSSYFLLITGTLKFSPWSQSWLNPEFKTRAIIRGNIHAIGFFFYNKPLRNQPKKWLCVFKLLLK